MTKHTILFLAANPLGTDRLVLDREAHAIQAELERSATANGSSWRPAGPRIYVGDDPPSGAAR